MTSPKRFAARLARRFLIALNTSYVLARFILNDAGKDHGISAFQKFGLARRIIRNTRKLRTLSRWQQHLVLAEEILRVPPSTKGDVVECGCFNGGSSASLSLACALTNRRLIVCDSFEGLPRGDDAERYDVRVDSAYYVVWEEGDFRSEGGLDGVKRNIERFGDIRVCQFVKGFFKDTLMHVPTNAVVLVFEDADLRSSVEDCVRHLWPKLQDGCKFYSHEPFSFHIVSLFYDEAWWQEHVGMSAPGFYGSGRGIIAGLAHSNVGYARRVDRAKVVTSGPRRLLTASRKYEEEQAATGR